MAALKIKMLILFVALHLAQSKSHRKNTGKPAFCKVFNCPTVEDPVCVQMIQPELEKSGNSTSGQRVVTMKFINKCEYKYMQCYPSIRGKVVEMSLCDQHAKKQMSNSGRNRTRRSACPQDCESNREENEPMVCGRCQHDIYKTFLSQCHLQKFACNHPDEAMALAARRACIFTGPQLEEERSEESSTEKDVNENQGNEDYKPVGGADAQDVLEVEEPEVEEVEAEEPEVEEPKEEENVEEDRDSAANEGALK